MKTAWKRQQANIWSLPDAVWRISKGNPQASLTVSIQTRVSDTETEHICMAKLNPGVGENMPYWITRQLQNFVGAHVCACVCMHTHTCHTLRWGHAVMNLHRGRCTVGVADAQAVSLHWQKAGEKWSRTRVLVPACRLLSLCLRHAYDLPRSLSH